MQPQFNLDTFINQKVTGRKGSLLQSDFQKYNAQMEERVNDKSVLVIGGAGTIGSSYIKAILRFNIKNFFFVFERKKI